MFRDALDSGMILTPSFNEEITDNPEKTVASISIHLTSKLKEGK
jgi:hypothetical protein